MEVLSHWRSPENHGTMHNLKNTRSTLTDSCDMNDACPLRTHQAGAASSSEPQGVHHHILEDPPGRLATPGGKGGKLLVALQPQPGRIDFSKSCTGM